MELSLESAIVISEHLNWAEPPAVPETHRNEYWQAAISIASDELYARLDDALRGEDLPRLWKQNLDTATRELARRYDEQLNALMGILADRSGDAQDREEAAMMLSAYNDARSLEALLATAGSADENEELRDEVISSITVMVRRNPEFLREVERQDEAVTVGVRALLNRDPS
jgi:hypothetical protein